MDTFNFALLAFTSFFTLINPLGVIPIFVAMTSDLNDRDRSKTAWKASEVKADGSYRDGDRGGILLHRTKTGRSGYIKMTI